MQARDAVTQAVGREFASGELRAMSIEFERVQVAGRADRPREGV